MRVAIVGYGKMGKEIEKILIGRGHEVPLKIDINNVDDLNAENLAGVDVAIEFTSPTTAFENVKRCLESGVAVVCGSTGWLERRGEIEALCKELGGAFFYSSNYSVGVNVMFKLNKELARIMKTLSEYNVSVEETHHIHKKDDTSGTAVSLIEQIVEERECAEESVKVTSYRVGEVPGEHIVTYDCDVDTIQLRHDAKSRLGFAQGAVFAAEFVAGKKGLFSMEDMLKL